MPKKKQNESIQRKPFLRVTYRALGECRALSHEAAMLYLWLLDKGGPLACRESEIRAILPNCANPMNDLVSRGLIIIEKGLVINANYFIDTESPHFDFRYSRVPSPVSLSLSVLSDLLIVSSNGVCGTSSLLSFQENIWECVDYSEVSKTIVETGWANLIKREREETGRGRGEGTRGDYREENSREEMSREGEEMRGEESSVEEPFILPPLSVNPSPVNIERNSPPKLEADRDGTEQLPNEQKIFLQKWRDLPSDEDRKKLLEEMGYPLWRSCRDVLPEQDKAIFDRLAQELLW